jgi:hypothetical protein
MQIMLTILTNLNIISKETLIYIFLITELKFLFVDVIIIVIISLIIYFTCLYKKHIYIHLYTYTLYFQ